MKFQALFPKFLPRMQLNLNHQFAPDTRSFSLRTFRLICLVSLVLCLFEPLLRAQNSKPPMLSSNRFLYVFDISAPMRKQTVAVQKAVQDMLESRASGQLHYGDTLGVWSFDAEVHAGFFPLQIWLPGQEQEISLRIGEYLKQQPVGKKSRPDKAMESLYEVIKSSDTITIFLFSTGESPMRGTPFDEDINAAYKRMLTEMKKAPMPIVTVLQAKNGKLLTYTVNPLPWPVVIPELPITIKAPKALAAASVPAPAPVPQKPALPTTPPPVAPKAPEPAITAAPAATLPPPGPKAEIAPVQAVPPTAPVPAPVPTTPSEQPATTTQIQPASAPPVPALPAPPVRPRAPLVTPPPLHTDAVPALPPAEPSVAANPPPQSNPVKPGPSASKSSPSQVATKSTNSPVVQPAVALPPGIITRPKILLVGAISLFAVALVLLVFTLRRSRNASGPSLISRSMNNLRK
jgi:hypothetical protein